MYCKTILPHALLRPHISRYLYIRVTSGRFHFPADGCPGLIINLKDPFLLGFDKPSLRQLTGCRLFGASTRFLMTQHFTGRTELMAVKYRPGQLTRFFNFPARELTDKSASLEVLCGVLGAELEEKLCGIRSITHLKDAMDTTLLQCLNAGGGHDQRISMALDTISRQGGQVRIETLAAQFHLSRRHFERLFLDVVGLTPKRMCRIARFIGVFSQLSTSRESAWADLAAGAGYSDQAHLVRECKYFTGHSPLAYLKHRSDLEHTVLG